MNQKYESLFQPGKISNVELKNRFVLCPMEGDALIGSLGGRGFRDENIPFYVDRARAGVGLFIAGAASPYNLTDHKWIYDDAEMFSKVQPVMDEVHKYDMKVFFQLTAGVGRNYTYVKPLIEHPEMAKAVQANKTMASADAGMPDRWAPQMKTEALTVDEIHHLVDALAEMAYLSQQNGVDGIEVHALHEGYLLDQFAMPYTNHRKDQYGGSLENRLRFTIEVLEEIKKRCGNDYPVILRYSVTSRVRDFGHGIIPQGDESEEIGRTLEESEKAIRILEDAGYDAFDCDNGTYDSWYYAHPPVYMPLNCNLETSEHIKKFTSKPIISAGRQQLDESADAVREGKIDFMGLGRQFLTDKDYIRKIREDRLEEVRPCISCNLGCLPIGLWKDSGALLNQTTFCALNPYTRQESKYAVTPAEHGKNIAVIGGGIAGMEFALQAVKRGHKVTIYEKSDRLGGVFNEAASFSFKEKDRDLLAYYRHMLDKLQIPVKYNTQIESTDEIDADEIVIATGAAGVRQLKVPGAENCVSALDFLRNWDDSCDRVAIIGGGLTGCEIAYELCLKGKHPYILEVMDDILMVKGSSMASTSFLRDAFEYYHMDVYTSCQTTLIEPNAVHFTLKDRTQKVLPADKIICSIGYLQGIPFDYSKETRPVHVIGDADHVANLKNAVWSANDAVISIR